jgi:putative sigma-54 modulation protein
VILTKKDFTGQSQINRSKMFNLNFFNIMKLQVHSIHFDADRKLVDFIQKKVDKLETFYDRLVDGEVFLRLNNEGIENKTVEIKLNIPGSQLFAIEKARSFEAAADQATTALKNQLKKFKTKIRNGRV